MTWNEFKNEVERQMKEKNISEDIKISMINLAELSNDPIEDIEVEERITGMTIW